MSKHIKKHLFVFTREQQELVNSTAEVFIRFYSDLYYGLKPNKLYLQAIQGNIDEWVTELDGDESVFTGAVVQALCMTLINIYDQEEE